MENNDFSCVKEVTKVVHLTLPSVYNSNEISGISDALESWKRQYIKQLQGIVVGYKNVSLTSKRGYLKVDCPVIHCKVKATFELFHPTVGSIIKGKINRVSQDYIGCLVHNTINVTVYRTADESLDISNFIVLDRLLLFQITRINFKPKFIHVKGKITEDCIILMRESGMMNDNINLCENSNLTCMSPDFSIGNEVRESSDLEMSTNTTSSHSIKDRNNLVSPSFLNDSLDSDMTQIEPTQPSDFIKKKKHKKSKSSSSMSHSLFSNSLDSEMSMIEPTQPLDGKKKKKSKNSLLMSPSLLSNSLDSEMSVIEPTQISNSTKKKKSKNSSLVSPSPLRNSLNSEMNLIEPTQLSTSTKKKKHRKSKEDSLLMSPSLLNNSLDSEVDQIEPTLLLNFTTNKKHKKSKNSSLTSPSPSLLSNMLKRDLCQIESSYPVDNTKKRKRKKSNESILNFESEKVENNMQATPPKKKRKIEKYTTSKQLELDNTGDFIENQLLSKMFPDLTNKQFNSIFDVTLNYSEQNPFIKTEKSTNLFNQTASPSKEKKHKLNNKIETSPSIFLEASGKVKDEIESTSSPNTISKKKPKKSENNLSITPSLLNEITTEKSVTELKGKKSKEKNKNKKGSHKKTDKLLKKKKKDKSKKDSKKDKKTKLRDKVLSTKKRLHSYLKKLDKKGKNKNKKSKISKKNKSKKEK